MAKDQMDVYRGSNEDLPGSTPEPCNVKNNKPRATGESGYFISYVLGG